MKTALKKFFMIMLLVVTPVSCVWADNVSDRKEIQTLFYSAVTSLNHKDAEGAAKTAAPDALLKRVDGTTLTIDEWKASTAKEFEGMKSFWTKFRLEKIDITDDQAKATYTETDNFLTVRQKSQRYHVVSRWNAELQKMPQGWLFKEFIQISERTIRDGKLLSSRSITKESGNIPERKEIELLFSSVSASLNHKDVEGMAKTAAPDALLKLIDGTTLTIDQWKANTAKDFEGMKSFRTKFRLEKIDITGDHATVIYTEIDNYTVGQQKSHRYLAVSRWNAELQKMPQGWLFKELTQVSERTSRDGKHLTSLVTGEVTRIRLVNYGRYEQKEIKNIRPSAEDEKMIGKQIVEIHQKHLQKTSRIKVGKGVLFGIEFKLVGKPLNSQAEVEVVHTHPPIKPPLPETEFSEQKYKVTAKIGSVCHALYMIENDWEMVEGKWTIQVNYHGRTLLEKTFELVRPKAAPSRKS